MSQSSFRALLLVLALAPPAIPAAAAAAGPPAGPESASTPDGAVRRYLAAGRAESWSAAAEFLDLDALPEVARRLQGPRLARHLLVVLDRELPLEHLRLARDEEGDVSDGLIEGLDRLGRVGTVELLLERREVAPGSPVWRLSASSVKAIPELYGKFGYGALGDYLPASMFQAEFLGLRPWQWLGLGLVVLGALLLAWIVERLGGALARRVARRTATSLDDELVEGLRHPARAILAVTLFSAGNLALVLAPAAYRVLFPIERTLAAVALAWLALRAVDLVGAGTLRRLTAEGRRAEAAVLPLATRAIKGLVWVAAAIAMLSSLGLNVTGIIAGLGVGGLAVALAAQKSIANLLGGVSLIADQPVRVGDVCRLADGQMGTVEAIGMRSTRVRTLDRTLITIPNAEFSELRLENYGPRDRIRLHVMLGLRYETSPDQLRWVLTELRRLLAAHPRVNRDPTRPRVRLTGFSASALEVEVQAYVETTDWNEFLAVREDLLLRMLDLIAASGTGLAFPTQTLQLGRDAGLDPARSAEAARRVAAWREAGSLPFPDLPESVATELAGTLDYPPTGSAGARR
jgi:MscS family membrane protein